MTPIEIISIAFGIFGSVLAFVVAILGVVLRFTVERQVKDLDIEKSKTASLEAAVARLSEKVAVQAQQDSTHEREYSELKQAIRDMTANMNTMKTELGNKIDELGRRHSRVGDGRSSGSNEG